MIKLNSFLNLIKFNFFFDRDAFDYYYPIKVCVSILHIIYTTNYIRGYTIYSHRKIMERYGCTSKHVRPYLRLQLNITNMISVVRYYTTLKRKFFVRLKKIRKFVNFTLYSGGHFYNLVSTTLGFIDLMEADDIGIGGLLLFGLE